MSGIESRVMPRAVPDAAAAAVPRPVLKVEALLQRIGHEFAGLSRQLKVIARYVEHHHEFLGLQRIQDVADRCGVQPSAVVRFAQHFGFSGYNELKRVFRDGIDQQIAPSHLYQERLREVMGREGAQRSSADIANDFVDGALDGLMQLRRDLRSSTLTDAVELLRHAATLWVAGARRAFPVASYLAYSLQHTDRPVQLVHFVGGMHEGQLRGVRAGDVMVAISFAPYAAETVLAAQLARSRGARVLAITDSRMSPLTEEAEVTLLVQEQTTHGFRALTNTMVLAQGLFIALTWQLEVDQLASARAVDAVTPAPHGIASRPT